MKIKKIKFEIAENYSRSFVIDFFVESFKWSHLNPFHEFGISIGAGNGSDPDSKWVVEELMEEWRETFESFELFEGKLKATDAKKVRKYSDCFSDCYKVFCRKC